MSASRTSTSVLVTGGASCLGIEVANQLRARGVEVTLFDLPEQIQRVNEAIASDIKVQYGSILDRSSVRESIAGKDAVIHLAERHGVRRTETNRLSCFEINVTGTQNLLEMAVAERIGTLVLGSSSEVYGAPHSNPVSEESSPSPSSAYAVTKLAAEELCRAYSQRYPWLRHVILRYFNVYGSYQVAEYAIPRFVAAVRKGNAPVVYGNGKQIRGYAHCRDAAEATIAALLTEEAEGHILNIGDETQPIELAHLAQKVIDASPLAKKVSPVFQTEYAFTDRPAARDVVARYCDSSKARTMLGFVPKVGLEDGLHELVVAGVIFETPSGETYGLERSLDDLLA